MNSVEIAVALSELAATGATVPWWLIAVAAAVVVLGVVALVLSRRRRNPEA